jgi:hypothetical protein
MRLTDPHTTRTSRDSKTANPERSDPSPADSPGATPVEQNVHDSHPLWNLKEGHGG